ncbi:unnamed protein product [Ilex paraguariensis]|uniref:Protein kinase domain-containing protein n=1 Tax=Ilex paraguariensis TaxID=185542 RepID=A0ABC8UN43_9AQUA
MPSFIMFVLLAFFTIMKSVFPQSPATDCILDIQFSSSDNNSNCIAGNWDGFLENNCCGSAFGGYLHALGRRANQTGLIFLNSNEQKDCLSSAKSIDRNVFSCGIEKLTSGSGGCSDYSVMDVVNKLGNRLRSLGEDCKLLDMNTGKFDKGCNACQRRWTEMGVSSNDTNDSMKVEADVCRFALLVSLTSQSINDEKWVQEIYKCLGNESLPSDDQGGKGGHKTKLSTASNDSPSEDSSCHSMSIKEVYSATNNLSALNFIGQGIAGKVYKGILSNGQHVAVKQIINDGQMETFVREVRSLAHVRHPNLVVLLGYYEGKEECFLVYELCENGNLSEWLFGKDKKTMSWIQRLEITIGCARGLGFLHTYPEGCIVHRDIKPTNILISDKFQGKLSDFGLSKVMNIDQSFVSSEVRGTFGYVDPEYQKNRHVNSSGDVYSFGIVLLQILSGQRVINLDMKRPMPLNKMARNLTKGGNVTDFADPKLNGEYSVEAFELILKLALSCTGLKQQRPSMEQVVARLETALDISTRMKSITPHFKPNVSQFVGFPVLNQFKILVMSYGCHVVIVTGYLSRDWAPEIIQELFSSSSRKFLTSQMRAVTDHEIGGVQL